VSTIGRKILKRICKQFVEASRLEYPNTGRRKWKTLIGAEGEKNIAVKRVQQFQAMLRTTDPPYTRPTTKAAVNIITELRKNALDRRMSASMRSVSIARLLQCEGFEITRWWESDAIDDLMAKHFTIETKTESESYAPSTVYKREANRAQALVDIRNMLLEDADRLRGRTVEEIASYLRLPETESTLPKTVCSISDEAIAELEELYRRKK
jgi:hypothetical protein